MALSNAERQSRWRLRRKSAAARNDVVKRVEDVVDQAINTVWTIVQSFDDEGAPETFEEFRIALAEQPASYLSFLFRTYLRDADEDQKQILVRGRRMIIAVLRNGRAY